MLVKPYGLLEEQPQLNWDAVLAVATDVRDVLNVLEQRVKDLNNQTMPDTKCLRAEGIALDLGSVIQ